jgi:hypothetical protein
MVYQKKRLWLTHPLVRIANFRKLNLKATGASVVAMHQDHKEQFTKAERSREAGQPRGHIQRRQIGVESLQTGTCGQ